MTPTAARELLVSIALEYEGKTEVTPNRAPWLKPLWVDTDYGDGVEDRAPWCAAFTAHVLAEWGRRLAAMGELKATTGKTLAQFNAWRCKSAGAWAWQRWAERKGVTILPDSTKKVPTGAFMVFDMSHIGIVNKDLGDTLTTVEGNTGPSGGREGDGCYAKLRNKAVARCFIVVI
jgi:hypothetical protein